MSEPHKPIVPYTEDEQNQASVAHNYFKQDQFDSVLGVVKKLLKNHPNDLCLMHNKVLTEFYKSGKTKTVEFKKSLSKIHKAFQQLKEEEDVVIKGEKTNHVTLCYNHALVMFNIHQFSEAQSLLEKLYPTLEGVEEQEYVKICLLLIECYLVNCHPAKAESIINDVRLFFPDLEESNKRTDKQPGQVTPEENEWLTNHLRYSRARCYLKQRMIKACKRELKTLTTHPQHNMPNVATVFLRSNFEFARCNYHKAYKLLGTSPTTAENNVLYDNLNTMCDNNLAVIYSSMGKYHLGNFYMEKALKENEIWINTALKQQNNGGKGSNNYPISILRMNKRYELLYNRGIQLLHGGDSSSAFDCFITVAQVYHSNPRLWLRIAECCIHKCTTASENEGRCIFFILSQFVLNYCLYFFHFLFTVFLLTLMFFKDPKFVSFLFFFTYNYLENHLFSFQHFRVDYLCVYLSLV
uniref:CCR4-NOT transcription complex subunit 10 n=1 Tax=Ciona savignyi TaxID=51511 RepID=H2Z940_CIOSA